MAKLRIAACQFPVSDDVAENARWVKKYMRRAKALGADIAHFPEAALCGYGGVDWISLDEYDWRLLEDQTKKVMALAAKLGLWVAVGSMHRLSAGNLPHNCIYLIGPEGGIVDRYDKRFCMKREMEYYTPGGHSVIREINGVRCGLAICFDLRFPELYRDFKRQGVQCVLQSFYNARQSGPSVHTDIMRQTMQAHAATNYFWASMTNSSACYSPYPSCFIQPDGKINAQLKFNRPGMMVNEVDTKLDFYDASADYRHLAMNGMLTNGPGRLNDPRSADTTSL
ncbi:MAG TPA: carbon-nitrogen hydrolase family protein [Sedimentisphaerales bacterium]|nr:carbon-nitrogen hydrolase family protein [Sedimentisphaerales bacterium]